MLTLTFADPANHDKVNTVGLDSFGSGKNLTLVAKHEDGIENVRIFF